MGLLDGMVLKEKKEVKRGKPIPPPNYPKYDVKELIKDNPKPKPIKNNNIKYLIDEFNQIKTYFRKGNRPSQKMAIENFEKHLNEMK